MGEKYQGNSRIGRFFHWLGNDLKDIGATFVRGDWKTKLSYIIMGFGQLCRGQLVRGITMLALEVGLLYFAFGFGLGNGWLLGFSYRRLYNFFRIVFRKYCNLIGSLDLFRDETGAGLS